MKKDKTYLVYDPETDTLRGMIDYESELISALDNSPEIKYEKILRDCWETVENKELFFERLDEITTFYFNKIRTWSTFKIPVPFLTRPSSLERIMELLETMREAYNQIGKNKHQLADRHLIENLKDLFKSDDIYNAQINILKSTDPPMLDDNCKSKVREREKSAWAAWIYVMNHKNFINENCIQNASEWSALLKKAFDVSVSATTLKKKDGTAFKKYKNQLLKRTN